MANSIKLRPLLPLTSNVPPAPIPISTAPKRKRPQVSAACNGCRKRKVKCDGARPCCYACSISKIPCVYPVPEGLSQREAQKLKLNHMSKAHESSRRVLELLRASRDGASTEILQQLQHSEHLDETIQSIADASLLLPKLGDQGGLTLRTSEPQSSPSITSQPKNSVPQSEIQQPPESPNTSLRSLLAETADSGVVLPVSRWTLVSQDDQFLTQLLDIFWTWDATLSRLIDRRLFISELKAASQGSGETQQQQRFCTPLLINAMLAISSLHMTRKHTNSTIDLVNLSQRFASHAFSLLDAERGNSSLTLLQSAAILWVYSRNEGSRTSLAQSANLVGLLQQTWAALGLESNGANLFKFSEEVTDDVGVWQAISSIAWGFYCFFAKMALVTSSQMPISRPLIMKIFEAHDGLDASSQSSTSSASEDPFAAQAAYQVQVFAAECSLCEIMDQLVSGFIRGGNRRVIRDEGHCTALYNKLLCWKLTLPEHLTTSRSVSPSVLMLQSTYDFVALEMLSAFARHSGVSFDGRNAASLQILHANSLVTNLWIYRGIYTLKHEYWAAEYCSFTAHTLLPFVETETAVHDVIAKACCILYEMGGKSGVSSRATSLLREVEETARDRSIRIPYYGKGSKSPESDGAPMVTVHGARVFGSANGGTTGGAGWYPASVTFSGTISDIEPAQAEVSGG